MKHLLCWISMSVLLLTRVTLTAGGLHINSPKDDHRISFEDDLELSKIQLNKDIELLHASVDLAALFSYSHWKKLLSNMSHRMLRRNQGRSPLDSALHQSKNDFLPVVKSEHLTSFLTRESLLETPLVVFIDCNKDPSCQSYRDVLSMTSVRRILNREFALFVCSTDDLQSMQTLQSFDGRLTTSRSTLFALTCLDGQHIRVVIYAPDEPVSEDSVMAFLRKVYFQKNLKHR